jgi:hypothetical protein
MIPLPCLEVVSSLVFSFCRLVEAPPLMFLVSYFWLSFFEVPATIPVLANTERLPLLVVLGLASSCSMLLVTTRLVDVLLVFRSSNCALVHPYPVRNYLARLRRISCRLYSSWLQIHLSLVWFSITEELPKVFVYLSHSLLILLAWISYPLSDSSCLVCVES